MKQLPTLQDWRSCDRCERCVTRDRLGLTVHAKTLSRNVRILVLGMAASRSAQATGSDDPYLLRASEALRDAFGLTVEEIQADVLLACGLGETRAANVATCGLRFCDVTDTSLELVVFVGRAVAAIARVAGLYRDGHWEPMGCAPVPAIVIGADATAEELADQVAPCLGRTSKRHRRNRRRLIGKTKSLLKAIGGHDGHGVLEPGRKWQRRPGRLTAGQIASHLAGELSVQAYRSFGDWPYVTVDVDRHNAVQESEFERTLRWLQQQFKHSLFVESSASKGVHVYIRLPAGTRYDHAATWLKIFITVVGQRWGKCGPVQAELMEVPAHPVRLPFGLGSSILGSKAPLDAQFDAFMAFVQSSDWSDFDRAKRLAVKRGGISARWSPSHNRRIAALVAGEELGRLTPERLEPGDPWIAIIPELPEPLQVIATAGIQSLGTRIRWTTELVRALVDLVPRSDVEQLMLYWLHYRNHLSEDIDTRLMYVQAETLDLINSRYEKLRGIPSQFWAEIRKSVTITRAHVYAARRDPNSLAASTGLGQRVGSENSYSLAKVLRTAFFVARRFYDDGCRIREVWREELERFTASNTAKDIGVILAGGTWLRVREGHVRHESSTKYALNSRLWPASPGDSVLYCPS